MYVSVLISTFRTTGLISAVLAPARDYCAALKAATAHQSMKLSSLKKADSCMCFATQHQLRKSACIRSLCPDWTSNLTVDMIAAVTAVQRSILYDLKDEIVPPTNETVAQVFARLSAYRDSMDGPQVPANLLSVIICATYASICMAEPA